MDIFKESMVPLIPELVKRPNKDGLDLDGDVILYGDNFYRGITPAGADCMIKLFDTGVIAELQHRELIPKTDLVPFEFPGYVFILQHEKIQNVSYAHEWSFSMFQDAALVALDVFEVLTANGFRSKDAHPGNVLFKNNRPVWVDLTSFIEKDSMKELMTVIQFFNDFLLPLELMAENPSLARATIKIDEPLLLEKIKLYLTNKFGFKRKRYFQFVLQRYVKIFERFILETDNEKIFRNIDAMRRRIKKLRLNWRSMWSEYHHDWVDDTKTVILSESTMRFLKIANIISSLPIKSVVEFAANQGMFSAIIAENPRVEKIVAIDNDEQAVDTMYKLLSQRRLSDNCVRKIFPIVASFNSNACPGSLEHDSLSDRTRADAVVALALTHHLLLSQHVPIGRMFQNFSRYTKRFIFVEFMPLGLWDGVHEPYPTPQWYTEEYFVQNMQKFFRVLMRLNLDTNRILFVGELK